MDQFAIALGVFIALHVGLSATGLRRLAVGAIGEGPYRGLFSLASLASLAWMIWSFGQARIDPANTALWAPPDFFRHIAHLLNTLGVILAAGSFVTPAPTLAGFEGGLNKPDPAKGFLRITRHPFLWGIAIWGAGHLLANPEAAAIMLFGGLALMVLLGTRSIDRKGAARNPENWARFAAATSNIPFAALIQGRTKLALGELALPLAVGLAAALATGFFHAQLFGVAAFHLPVG
jgi:uncharacterized membrane protein